MAAETNVLSIPVRMDTAAFREFSAFDVLTRQKRWRRPLLFAVLMVAFAIVCFTQVGQREGAALLGTVLTVVGTNIPLNKVQASRLARMAATGLPRAIRPAHLLYDGDIVFVLAAKTPPPTATGPWTENLLGCLGAEAVARAAADAVTHAADAS